MRLIGLCGAAGAGKGSVATILRSLGFVEVSFADPLYAAVAAITGIPTDRLRDRAVKEAVIPWVGKSPRQLLQTLGTEWGRQMVCDDLWVLSALRAASRHDRVVVPDVRFDNEARAIRERGGVVLKVVRPGASCLTADTSAHESEAGISVDLVDCEIVNDGGLTCLPGKVDAAIQRLPTHIM